MNISENYKKSMINNQYFLKHVLIALFCLLSHIVLSQNDYREGFILTQNNDTIKGLINYKESSLQYAKCRFKKTNDDKAQSYDPDQLKAYWFVNDKHFVSKTVRLQNQTTKLFLEYLVKGKVSLYSYGINYFVQKDQDSLIHLENETVQIKKGLKTYATKSNRHIAILSYMLSDCPELKKQLDHIVLTEKKLTVLIENYNRCVGVEPISFKAKKQWAVAKISPMIGLNASTNVYTLIVGNRGYSKTFPTAYSPYGGINVDFFFPRIHERIFLNAGAFYLKVNYEATSMTAFDNLGNNDDYTVDSYATESLSQLKLPFGLGYSFPEKKVTPIIKGGLSVNFLLSHSSYLQVSYDRYNQVHYDDVFIDPFSFPSNSLGYWLGFGLETKLSQRFNALIDLRYEKATATNIQLMFGITF